MQSDKDLLMLAAQAYWAGEIDDVVSIEWSDADNGVLYTHADNQDHNGSDRTYMWNPTENDGECARLEAACQIDVEWQRIGVVASHAGGERFREAYTDHGGDKNKARRYASTRAAAQLAQAQENPQ